MAQSSKRKTSIAQAEHLSVEQGENIDAKKVANYSYNGEGWERQFSALATVIQTSGSDTFVGEALPGSDASSAVWRAQKIDTNGNITWADGDANYDNVATDLTALSYS